MPLHPLTNFDDMQKYYQNEPKFNGVYGRNNLNKKWDIYNKSWWIPITRDSLDYTVCKFWKCNILW